MGLPRYFCPAFSRLPSDLLGIFSEALRHTEPPPHTHLGSWEKERGGGASQAGRNKGGEKRGKGGRSFCTNSSLVAGTFILVVTEANKLGPVLR